MSANVYSNLYRPTSRTASHRPRQCIVLDRRGHRNSRRRPCDLQLSVRANTCSEVGWCSWRLRYSKRSVSVVSCTGRADRAQAQLIPLARCGGRNGVFTSRRCQCLCACFSVNSPRQRVTSDGGRTCDRRCFPCDDQRTARHLRRQVARCARWLRDSENNRASCTVADRVFGGDSHRVGTALHNFGNRVRCSGRAQRLRRCSATSPPAHDVAAQLCSTRI